MFWGSPRNSLEAARLVNDDMAAQQQAFPDRIRFMCSLPWQHPKLALAELKRACDELGAVGVMQLANVDGVSLTDKRFAPVWKEIDRRGLPVLIHPSAPPGTKYLDVMKYNLIASVGFMFDTSLAVARMIFDGFLDRYPNLKLIAAHGGGALPYLAGRLDICFDNMPACRERISKQALELVPEADLLRHRGVPAGVARARASRSAATRQRALRLRLSAQHRRHEGLPRARRRAPPRSATPCAAATPCGSSSCSQNRKQGQTTFSFPHAEENVVCP